MRITYRYSNNKDYWDKRWADTPIDSAMTNNNKYPLKYAEMMIKDNREEDILEAGCGAGRILRYFHERGFNITGIDFIPDVIDKLKQADRTLNVVTGDITKLNFKDNSFQYILAFGLYHNLPMDKIIEAISETFRITKSKGKVCASFRADNFQNRLNDFITKRRECRSSKKCGDRPKQFHKMNLKKNEFRELFERTGFEIKSISSVENMPLLYKFSFFRHDKHKAFNEKLGRSEGYLLSPIGTFIHNMLVKFFPDQFCNIYVLIAQKN